MKKYINPFYQIVDKLKLNKKIGHRLMKILFGILIFIIGLIIFGTSWFWYDEGNYGWNKNNIKVSENIVHGKKPFNNKYDLFCKNGNKYNSIYVSYDDKDRDKLSENHVVLGLGRDPTRLKEMIIKYLNNSRFYLNYNTGDIISISRKDDGNRFCFYGSSPLLEDDYDGQFKLMGERINKLIEYVYIRSEGNESCKFNEPNNIPISLNNFIKVVLNTADDMMKNKDHDNRYFFDSKDGKRYSLLGVIPSDIGCDFDQVVESQKNILSSVVGLISGFVAFCLAYYLLLLIYYKVVIYIIYGSEEE